jgi:2',3'-cyclic-nucleotide 2'-phosphodiesterase (5'-nucleotidase family)
MACLRWIICTAITIPWIALAEPVYDSEPNEIHLVILHTNDIHGHMTSWQGWEGDLAGKTIGGFDRLATAIARERKNAEHVLLLDAGDTVSDTMIGMKTRDEAIIELMNALEYDAMTIGNHELDFSPKDLRALMRKASFPILAANIRERGTEKLFAQPYIIRQLGPLRIGILGIAYPNTPLTTATENVSDIEFEETEPTAKHFVPQMRQAGVDIVVVLSHLGLNADIQLAQAVLGIDVIVGGHSHNRMTKPKRIADTLIVQAGAHGSDLGVLELAFHGTRRTESSYRLITLDHAEIKPDPVIVTEIDRLTAQLRAWENEVMGKAGDWLIRAQTLAGTEPRKRDQESPVDSLFADIIREVTGADIAFLPGVGYGIAIPPGPITTSALKNLVPHESHILLMKMNAVQLLEVLEQSIENTYADDPAKKIGGIIQVSGLAFTYDPQRSPGARILAASVSGTPLNSEKLYRVATNSLLAQGGHGYSTFPAISAHKDRGSQFEMIGNWLRSHPGIITPPLGRIQWHANEDNVAYEDRN